MQGPLLEVVWLAAALTSSLIGSVHDLRHRRIPNLLTGPSLLVAMLVHFVVGGWSSMFLSVCAGLLAGFTTLIFYLVKGMGAGDVKLMTAIGCWVGLRALPQVFFAIAVTSLIWATLLLIRHQRTSELFRNLCSLARHHRHNGLLPHSTLNIQAPGNPSIPFAVPIACGCLFALCIQIRSTFL